jgi:hypothetical protein
MSHNSNENHSSSANVRSTITVPELLRELQRWYDWGDDDKTGRTVKRSGAVTHSAAFNHMPVSS